VSDARTKTAERGQFRLLHARIHQTGIFEEYQHGSVTLAAFAQRLVLGGLLVVWGEDREGKALADRISSQGRRVETYGLDPEWDWWAQGVELGNSAAFEVWRQRKSLGTCALQVPGRHNVLNSLAAIAVATELGIEDAAIQRALAGFQGIDRRLQVLGDVDAGFGRVTLVDDYGHHPTEIAATLDAARQAWPDRRIVLVFEPHRYTRTRDLLDDFAQVLSTADVLVVAEVYPAGEAPIAGADGKALCRAIRSRGVVEPVLLRSLDELPQGDRDKLLPLGGADPAAR